MLPRLLVLIIVFTVHIDHPVCAQEVIHIANSGVLVHSGKTNILIDSFFEDGRGMFTVPTQGLIQNMVNGQAPYNNLSLSLVTHAHPDHFDPALLAQMLQAKKDVKCITTPQVIEAVKKTAELPEGQMITYPLSRSWKYFNNDNFRLESAYSHHAGRANVKIQNMVFLITINGKKILHLGDSEMELNRFQELRLTYEDIDVALVPFWYMTNLYGAELVQKYIDAKKVIAIHVPASDQNQSIEKIKKFMPEAIIFQKAGQSVRF